MSQLRPADATGNRYDSLLCHPARYLPLHAFQVVPARQAQAESYREATSS